MSQRAIIMSIVLFALIVVGMFVFAFLEHRERVSETNIKKDEEIPSVIDPAPVSLITAKHFYIDGVHTLVGEIDMPTPCHLLETSSQVAESFPEQVLIEFSVINNAEDCIQVVTPQRFLVTATASLEAVFRATFMGQPVELNLIPAEAGETPDDFELFYKG